MAGMDTPINRLALDQARREAARLGTFKVVGDLQTGVSFEYVGGPQHGERVSYSKLKETLERSQFRMREVFSPGQVQPGSGWYKYPWLNTLSEEWSKEVTSRKSKYGKGAVGTVIRDSHGIESQLHANALASALAGGKGFAVVDDDSASVLRLMVGDKEASYDEIKDFLRRRFGLSIGEGSKVDKRLKALMSMRGIGSAEMVTSVREAKRLTAAGRASEIVGRYKVGVFGEDDISNMAKLMGHKRGAADLAKKATDGQSLIRASVLRHQIAKMRAEGHALLGANAQQDLSGMRIRKRGHDMLAQADELERGMKEGRIFGNIRMMGLDVVEMKNGKAVPSLQGQIRGDGLVIEDDVMDANGGRGLDVMTAKWNITKDLKMTKARLLTIERHVPHEVFLDVQSVSSFPQFFPVDRMKQKMLDDFDAVLSKNAPFEDMQKGLLAMVKQIDDAVEEFGPGNRLFEGLDAGQRIQAEAELRKAADFGMDIKETLRLKLHPHERPGLMSSFMTSYRRFLLAEKKGSFFPRMRVPDAKAAGIMTHSVEQVVKEGYVGYSSRTASWVMHGKTFAELYKSLGGADLDDTLVNLLRWDESIDPVTGKAGGLKAVLYRQPNAMTEFAIVNADPMDDWVDEVMQGKGTAQAKIWNEARGTVYRSRADIARSQRKLEALTQYQQPVDRQIAKLRERQLTAGDNERYNLMKRIREHRAQKKLPAYLEEQNRIAGLMQEHEEIIADAKVSEARAAAQMQADLEMHLERINVQKLKKSGSIKKKGNYWIGHDERIQFYKTEVKGTKEPRTWQSVIKRLENWSNSGKNLGQYSNYKMVQDAHRNSLGAKLTNIEKAAIEAVEQESGLKFAAKLWTLETESSIDASILEAGIKVKVEEGMPLLGEEWTRGDPRYRRVKLAEFQEQGIRETLTNMAIRRKAGVATAGIDPYMITERLEKSGSMEAARGIFAELQEKLGLAELGPGYENLEKFLEMKPNDTLAVMSQMERAFIDNMAAMYGDVMIDPETGRLLIDPVTGKVKETPLGAKAKQYLDELVQPESLRAYGKGYKPAANDLLNEFSDAVARHTYNPTGVDKSLAGILDNAEKVDWSAAEADVLDKLRPYMDIDASGREFVGRNIDQRMAALLVESKRSGRYGLTSLAGGDVSISRLARRAELASRLHAGRMTDFAGNEVAIPEETRALWQEELDKKIWATDWDAASLAKRDALGLGRQAAEQARKAAAAADTSLKPIKATPFERIKLAALKGLDSTSGRWVGAGVGLLAAMGVLHATRRDHTPEDMAGPPNLPGGNPYMGPMGGGYSFGSSMEGGQGGGVTYDVRARGGDPQALARQASFIVGPDSMGGSYSQSRSLESPDKQRERLMASFN